MRGKGSVSGLRRVSVGITPAYAGKSDFFHRAGKLFRDHPRLCGEKLAFSHLLTTISGSPPPMRGKGGLHLFAADRQGITPAYAGKSCRCCRRQQKQPDHPRLCGEKGVFKKWSGNAGGSPPPMRGKGPLWLL